jgi:hypothetical protein
MAYVLIWLVAALGNERALYFVNRWPSTFPFVVCFATIPAGHLVTCNLTLLVQILRERSSKRGSRVLNVK